VHGSLIAIPSNESAGQPCKQNDKDSQNDKDGARKITGG
jgi:hypothetical protein